MLAVSETVSTAVMTLSNEVSFLPKAGEANEIMN